MTSAAVEDRAGRENGRPNRHPGDGQEQGLLGHRREDVEEYEGELGHAPRRPRGWCSTFLIAVAALVLLLMTAGWMLNSGITAGSHDHDTTSGHAHEADVEAEAHVDPTTHLDITPTLHSSTSIQSSTSASSTATRTDLQHTVSTSSPTPTIQGNDYLLDRKWDLDAAPQRREYHWTVKDQEHNPDGIYRPMMLVNSQFPGPLIEVNEGDTVVVHVDNQATNATSIHWHGIYQRDTPWMDGTVGVTQCAIAPGTSFTYEFTITGQTGTYWWHAHQGVQSSDGLHGPLVVHSPSERLIHTNYATDRVILVSDHYHDLSSALLWQYLKPNMENAEPVPIGALINGKAIRDCDQFPDRRCDNTTSNVGTPHFSLKPNDYHRIRFINVGAFAEFQLQVDEHEMAVVEVDGTDVSNDYYHRIYINPGQRYSVEIRTSNTKADNFWFRARMIKQCFTDAPPELQEEVRAVVTYKTEEDVSDSSPPTSMDWTDMTWLECKDMNSTFGLSPIEYISAGSRDADAFFYIRSNFEIGAYRLSRGFFNQSSWRPDPYSPILNRAIDGLSTGNASFRASASTITSSNTSTPNPDESPLAFINTAAFNPSRDLILQTTSTKNISSSTINSKFTRNSPPTIDILIHNFDEGAHPFHLHGHKFFVLASGHGYPPLAPGTTAITPHNLAAKLYNHLNLQNPLRRDTASVMGYSWLLIRVVADNPGVWALHCHLAWHSEAGLLMNLITGSEELGNMRVPEENLGLCGRPGVEKGTGPDDEGYRAVAEAMVGGG